MEECPLASGNCLAEHTWEEENENVGWYLARGELREGGDNCQLLTWADGIRDGFGFILLILCSTNGLILL